jgi:hypothetical protein
MSPTFILSEGAHPARALEIAGAIVIPAAEKADVFKKVRRVVIVLWF